MTTITVGMHAELGKAITEHDINAFVEISVDRNPVHLDEAYAKTTIFVRCIAYGV